MSFILRKLQGGNLRFLRCLRTSRKFIYLSLHLRKQFLAPFIPTQFGLYILFPIGWMYYFGTNLDERFSVPGFWPTAEQSHKIPLEKEAIDRELWRMRMVEAVRRERRLEIEAGQAETTAQQVVIGHKGNDVN